MSKNNGTMPTFTFDFENVLASEMDVLIVGGSITNMAPVIAKIVTACSENIGPLDDPQTYLNLKWKVWKYGVMEQLREAAKNA